MFLIRPHNVLEVVTLSIYAQMDVMLQIFWRLSYLR
jgi:hypothetical protein